MELKKNKKLKFDSLHKIINDEFIKHNMSVSKNTVITWCYDNKSRRNPSKRAIPVLSKATGIKESRFWADYKR